MRAVVAEDVKVELVEFAQAAHLACVELPQVDLVDVAGAALVVRVLVHVLGADLERIKLIDEWAFT